MLFLLAALAPMAQARLPAEWRNSSAAEQAQDAVAFAGLDQAIREDSPDVQSALSTLTGIALEQGHLASVRLGQRVDSNAVRRPGELSR
jgi:hypothetical protein